MVARGCSELNSGPLEEQSVLLSSEPSLWPAPHLLSFWQVGSASSMTVVLQGGLLAHPKSCYKALRRSAQLLPWWRVEGQPPSQLAPLVFDIVVAMIHFKASKDTALKVLTLSVFCAFSTNKCTLSYMIRIRFPLRARYP